MEGWKDKLQEREDCKNGKKTSVGSSLYDICTPDPKQKQKKVLFQTIASFWEPLDASEEPCGSQLACHHAMSSVV